MRAMAMVNLAANNLVSKRMPVFCRAPDQRRCCPIMAEPLRTCSGVPFCPDVA